MNIAEHAWTTIVDTRPQGGWIYGKPYLAFAPDTDPNWQLQIITDVDGYSNGYIQVMYGPLMGDADSSGYVDDDDLSLLLANWNTGTIWAQGDFDEDGDVDDDDLSLLLARWNAGTPPLGDAAIPEPATLALLAIGAAGMIARKKR